MNYIQFLFIVNSNRKYLDWNSKNTININGLLGRVLYMKMSGHAYMILDAYQKEREDINVSEEKVNHKWAVREVFEASGQGSNK